MLLLSPSNKLKHVHTFRVPLEQPANNSNCFEVLSHRIEKIGVSTSFMEASFVNLLACGSWYDDASSLQMSMTQSSLPVAMRTAGRSCASMASTVKILHSSSSSTTFVFTLGRRFFEEAVDSVGNKAAYSSNDDGEPIDFHTLSINLAPPAMSQLACSCALAVVNTANPLGVSSIESRCMVDNCIRNDPPGIESLSTMWIKALSSSPAVTNQWRLVASFQPPAMQLIFRTCPGAPSTLLLNRDAFYRMNE